MKEQNDNTEVTVLNIEITEGCTAYSYKINGIEWADLTDPESEHYTGKHGGLLMYAFIKLYHSLIVQYDIPGFLSELLWDNDNDDWEQVPCTQDTFVKMVKANKNTEVTYDDYVCDCCGDTVTIYRLVIK